MSTLAADQFTFPTGNLVWVDKNGNDEEGVRSKGALPFLTIQAAIDAAQAGDVVIVRPGTYNEVLVCKDDVSVRGLDRRWCIIARSAAVSETVVTLAERMIFDNFRLSLSPSNGTTTGILAGGTTNTSSLIRDIRISATPTGSGVVSGLKITGSGVGNFDDRFVENCILTAQGATGKAVESSGTGTTGFRQCVISGGTGTGVLVGANTTLIINTSNLDGTVYALDVAASGTIKLGLGTSYTSIRNNGTILTDAFNFPRNNYTAVVDPVLTDDYSKGYGPGSTWLNTATNTLYTCSVATVNNASWGFVQTNASPAAIPTPGEHFLGTLLDYGAAAGTGAGEIQYARIYLTAGTVITKLRCYIDSNSSAARSVRMGIYDNVIAGTVTATNGSPTITGSGTAFTTDLKVGQQIIFGNQLTTTYTILSIEGNTSLTLSANFTGSTSDGLTLTSAASAYGVPGNRVGQTDSTVTTGSDASYFTQNLTSNFTAPVSGYYWTAFITDSTSLKFSTSPGVYRSGFLPVRHQSGAGTTLPAIASGLSNPSSALIYVSAVDNTV